MIGDRSGAQLLRQIAGHSGLLPWRVVLRPSPGTQAGQVDFDADRSWRQPVGKHRRPDSRFRGPKRRRWRAAPDFRFGVDQLKERAGSGRRLTMLPGRAGTGSVRPQSCLFGRLSLMCNSRSCLAETSLGAPMSRSSARWFIGNGTTSRRLSSPQSSITMRSMPGAIPP